jgi:hypothetical protein
VIEDVEARAGVSKPAVYCLVHALLGQDFFDVGAAFFERWNFGEPLLHPLRLLLRVIVPDFRFGNPDGRPEAVVDEAEHGELPPKMLLQLVLCNAVFGQIFRSVFALDVLERLVGIGEGGEGGNG